VSEQLPLTGSPLPAAVPATVISVGLAARRATRRTGKGEH
jgi:hypothetical protein